MGKFDSYFDPPEPMETPDCCPHCLKPIPFDDETEEPDYTGWLDSMFCSQGCRDGYKAACDAEAEAMAAFDAEMRAVDFIPEGETDEDA